MRQRLAPTAKTKKRVATATSEAATAVSAASLTNPQAKLSTALRWRNAPVPVVLRHNETLELNVAEYHGAITLGELQAVAEYLAANRSFLKCDCLSIVFPGATFENIAFDDLDRIFGRYQTLYAPLNFQIIRRSAWLCFS